MHINKSLEESCEKRQFIHSEVSEVFAAVCLKAYKNIEYNFYKHLNFFLDKGAAQKYEAATWKI